MISPEISPDFLKICADSWRDFQRFSRALPLVRSSLRSLQASFAALSSEDGDLPERVVYFYRNDSILMMTITVTKIMMTMIITVTITMTTMMTMIIPLKRSTAGRK